MTDKNITTCEAENAGEVSSSDDQISAEQDDRPPRDPNARLYTFLSLLIFAVCYIGWRLISQNIILSYALYEDTPSPELMENALSQAGLSGIPEGWELEYIRLHSGFDNDRLYICLSSEDDDIYSAPDMLPFDCGDPSEEMRFSVMPRADMEQRAVFGRMYTDISDPFRSCVIYEDGDIYALFCTSDYDKSIAKLFEGEKIRYGSERDHI